MTDEQITALAREYAEGYTRKTYPNAPGHVRERIIEGRLEHMEDFIPWLLRRYCLVEKSKVEEEYQEAKFTCGNVNPCSDTFAASLAQKSVLERLFPEIAKEAE